VVIAPHPGDEVVTCGGLLQLLSSLGHPLQLLSITDGSASHPGSRQWSEKRLSVFRPQESVEALRRLGLPMHSLKWVRGGFTDNALCDQQAQVTEFIGRYLRRRGVQHLARRWQRRPRSGGPGQCASG
jgi:LmbE family N-acetylglucosaminyl deacetylase